MAKRKMTKNDTNHNATPTNNGVNSGATEWLKVIVPLVPPVVLLLNDTT